MYATALWALTHVPRSSRLWLILQWLTGGHLALLAALQVRWPRDRLLVKGRKGDTSWGLLGKSLLPREKARDSQGESILPPPLASSVGTRCGRVTPGAAGTMQGQGRQ